MFWRGPLRVEFNEFQFYNIFIIFSIQLAEQC